MACIARLGVLMDSVAALSTGLDGRRSECTYPVFFVSRLRAISHWVKQ